MRKSATSLRGQGFATIAVDKPTRARLNRIALNAAMPLSDYLREFSTQSLARSARLGLVKENGEIRRGTSRDSIPVLVEEAIRVAIESNPGLKDWGWYHQMPCGCWYFDLDAYRIWEKEDNERKDREFAEREKQYMAQIEKEK